MMDMKLWRAGREVAREKGRLHKNWELDFVRGLHQGAALRMLAKELTITTGLPVRLMSIWVDKNAWVSWKDSTGAMVRRRELADLAVFVRRPTGSGMAQWMWLLQAKRTMSLLDSYGGTSSPYELDLLHRMPDFSLLEGDGRSRRFIAKNIALTTDFAVGKPHANVGPWPCPGTVPWTFLDFDNDVKDAGSAFRSNFSPVSARWLGTPVAPVGSWAEKWLLAEGGISPLLASYTACLRGIVSGQLVPWRHPNHLNMLATFAPGAPLEPLVYPQWYRLYQALMTRSVGGVSGHAKASGNASGSILQFSQLMAKEAHTTAWLQGLGFPALREEGSYTTYSPVGLGQWAIAGLPTREAIQSLRAFDDQEASSSASHEHFVPEIDGEDTEPPLVSESAWEDGNDGGMQVLFVDLLTPPG